MPIDLQYNQEKRALYAVVRAPLTIGNFESSFVTVLESDDYPPSIRTLWDMRQLDFGTIDRRFGETLIAARKRLKERGEARLAFVTANDLGFGMMRMYQILSSDLSQQIKVFREYSEAEDWLLSELG